MFSVNTIGTDFLKSQKQTASNIFSDNEKVSNLKITKRRLSISYIICDNPKTHVLFFTY